MRWFLTRGVAILGAIAAVVAIWQFISGVWDGGPSEREMAKALGAGEEIFLLGALPAVLFKNLGAEPGSFEDRMLVVSGAILKDVKRIECIRSSREPGFVCTFEWIAEGKPNEGAKPKTTKPFVGEGRFVRTSEGWKVMVGSNGEQ